MLITHKDIARRLMGQEKYLKNKTLHISKFVSNSEKWDHGHCAFCSKKIDANTTDTFYTTEDNSYWICEDCYNDFKQMFNLKTR
jgi:histone acetyltransferase (RNA polymerase elongator complex component)